LRTREPRRGRVLRQAPLFGIPSGLKNKIKIFCDFDGTVTLNDVWMAIGNYFIRDKKTWQRVITDFESQLIGARECLLKELSLIENFNTAKFNEIIDSQQIDDTFKPFLEFCKGEFIPVVILSDGMDYYIERIFKRCGIGVEFYSNHCEIETHPALRAPLQARGLTLTFPYSDSECGKCGCCKRNFILNMTADDEVSVLIGDGYSDVCPVKYADFVFAKKSLASYCWKNNITYFDFKTFGDVQKKLERLMKEGKIRQRQQAKLNRREVFFGG
jgi:2-hydroxy-3-keto-5-methylthiopentenyl-1-phosphate phosphatase